MTLIDLCGYLGAVLISAVALPQLVRLLRTRQTEGVSAFAWALQAICCLAFGIYGLHIASLPQVLGNVLPVAGAIAVTALVLRSRPEWSGVRTAVALVGLAAYTVALVVTPPVVAGTVAVGLSLVARWPQVTASIGSARSGTATEVAVGTWVLMLAGMATWMVYGIGTQDWAVIGANIIGITATIIILVAELTNPANRRRSPQPPAQPQRPVEPVAAQL